MNNQQPHERSFSNQGWSGMTHFPWKCQSWLINNSLIDVIVENKLINLIVFTLLYQLTRLITNLTTIGSIERLELQTQLRSSDMTNGGRISTHLGVSVKHWTGVWTPSIHLDTVCLTHLLEGLLQLKLFYWIKYILLECWYLDWSQLQWSMTKCCWIVSGSPHTQRHLVIRVTCCPP